MQCCVLIMSYLQYLFLKDNWSTMQVRAGMTELNVNAMVKVIVILLTTITI